eukprot:gene12106-12245_t
MAVVDSSAALNTSDLPHNVLDAIFGFCDQKSALAALPMVCQNWKLVFEHSHLPLPPLSLTHPLRCNWLQQYSRRITHLTLRRVSCVQALEQISNLRFLRIEDSPKLDDLSVLQSPQMAHLDTLSLYACRNLTDLRPLAALPCLRTLMLDRCSWDLTCLSGHPSLEELHLGEALGSEMYREGHTGRCNNNRQSAQCMVDRGDLTPVARFSTLQQLDIDAVEVCDLTPLSLLTELQDLNLFTLQDESLNFEMLSPLSSLVQLRSLGLQGSDAAIPELAPWHQLQHNLTRVDLHGSYVSDLQPLLCLTGLQQLDLGLARQLKDLGDISKLVSLTQLNLKGCAGLTDLQPVQLLNTLRELQQP